MTTSDTQYLVRGADGHDYARVEPWEGGLPAAERAARRLHGYVMQLDDSLCVPRGAQPVADFREAGRMRRRSDGARGSLEFTHSPRVYFRWEEDGR